MSADIVTPCHGRPVRVTLQTVGAGYASHEEVDRIVCDEPGCLNEWDPHGVADPRNKAGGAS